MDLFKKEISKEQFAEYIIGINYETIKDGLIMVLKDALMYSGDDKDLEYEAIFFHYGLLQSVSHTI